MGLYAWIAVVSVLVLMLGGRRRLVLTVVLVGGAWVLLGAHAAAHHAFL
jgi:hypothetical protein